MNYYNENCSFSAAWLRELIKDGQIPVGHVDERDIRDVLPSDLDGYVQCHFFAGIAGWSLALQLAGWPADRPVWTGSCPCQSFSAAGAGKGFADERHLWPAWFHLISECKPPVVFGEQVEAAVRHGWLDLVQADLEGEDYAVGATVLGAHSVGAPHIRQRLWWVADRHGEGCGVERSVRLQRTDVLYVDGCSEDVGVAYARRKCSAGRGDLRDVGSASVADERASEERQRLRDAVDNGGAGELANTERSEWRSRRLHKCGSLGPTFVKHAASTEFAGNCLPDGLGNAAQFGWQQGFALNGGLRSGDSAEGQFGRFAEHNAVSAWSDIIWLPCRDGKARPTQSCFQSVVDGLSAGMVPLLAADTEVIKEEIDGSACASVARETLFDLQQAYEQGSQCEWPIRGCNGFQSAQVLLAFLRQLAAQGWHYAPRLSEQGAQAREDGMRVLRRHFSLGGASRGRGLDERSAIEFTDAMRVLSSILAQHASAHWGEILKKDASPLSPLAHGVPNRVGTLRGAGNAIVPQVGAEFIKAYLTARAT